MSLGGLLLFEGRFREGVFGIEGSWRRVRGGSISDFKTKIKIKEKSTKNIFKWGELLFIQSLTN